MRINEQWTWFVELRICHHMRFHNLSQIPCHRHKCILSRRLMLTVVLAPHLTFRYLKQWICRLICFKVCLCIDLPIPRAKCGRTNDAIEFACGIWRSKNLIRLFSNFWFIWAIWGEKWAENAKKLPINKKLRPLPMQQRQLPYRQFDVQERLKSLYSQSNRLNPVWTPFRFATSRKIFRKFYTFSYRQSHY